MPRKCLKKLATQVPLLTTDLTVPPATEEGQITPPIEAVLGAGTTETTEALAHLQRDLNEFMNAASNKPPHVEQVPFDISEYWNPEAPPTRVPSPVKEIIDLTADTPPRQPQHDPEVNHNTGASTAAVSEGGLPDSDLLQQTLHAVSTASEQNPPPTTTTVPTTGNGQRPSLEQYRYVQPTPVKGKKRPRNLSTKNLPAPEGFQYGDPGYYPDGIKEPQQPQRKKRKSKIAPFIAAAGVSSSISRGDTTTTDVGETSSATCPAAADGGPPSQSQGAEFYHERKAGLLRKRLANFRVVPLTREHWPPRFGFQEANHQPTPNQLFYPPGDATTFFEVYHEPNIRGVCIRRYANMHYEKRINLSAKNFRALHHTCAAIIDEYHRVLKAANEGCPTVELYVDTLDSGPTQVLVNLYKGTPKVHIGTQSYIEEMCLSNVVQRQPSTPDHCGSTVSLPALQDILKRVGPALQRTPGFYSQEEDNCDLF